MKKEKTGFAAFDKTSGKGLNVVFGFSTYTYLTDDPDKVHLDTSEKQLQMYCNWYNKGHKNQKEFEIKEVVLVTELRPVKAGD